MSLKKCHLADRRLLSIKGADRISFLQGLVSNDVNKVTADHAIYSAFLTPQGKYLSDFFIYLMNADELLLDVDPATFEGFFKKLKMYKLRSDVTLEDVSETYDIYVLFDGTVSFDDNKTLCWADPRLTEMGYRCLVKKGEPIAEGEDVPFEDYDYKRIQLGLGDGSRDFIVDKSILLENGFDELNGVDWNKGCYMGQELTARTKYRALIKKRLVPVMIEGDIIESSDPIVFNGKDVGEIRSHCKDMALATLKIEHFNDPLTYQGKTLKVQLPDWIKIHENKDA